MAEPKKSSSSIILDAVQDLHVQEQVVTREALVEVTGLKLSIVDDRIGVLIEDGLVMRKRAGVFIPAMQFPAARAISKTVLPGGMVKVEIGDEILTLTPREDRALAALQAGVTIQYAAIELGHQSAVLAAELAEQVRKLTRQVQALQAKTDPDQLALIS